MNLSTLTDDELLRTVDRSNKEVKELAERLQTQKDLLVEINIAIKELGEVAG